nr:hypothetical protein CFP56_19070 [Quercus suber]
MKHDLGYTQGIAVSSDGASGGLALIWKPISKVELSTCSRWHIDAYVGSKSNGDFGQLTGFYGQSEASKREETWTLLESLSHSNYLPWQYIGDFNEITSTEEKSGGNSEASKREETWTLLESLSHSNYLPWQYIGDFNEITREGRLKICLDRALATNEWRLKLHEVAVHHMTMSTSDHSLLTLRLTLGHRKNNKLFRFEAMWQSDHRCDDVVSESWQDGLYKIGGCPFTNCMTSCRESLEAWNKWEFGHVRRKIASL